MAILKKGSVIRKTSSVEEIGTTSYLDMVLDRYLDRTDYLSTRKTFTPTLAGTTTAGNHSYIRREGEYIEFAGLVFFTLQIMLRSKGSDTSGNMTIEGLPFKAKHNTGVTMARPKGIDTGGYEQLSGIMVSGRNRIWLYKNSPRTGSNFASIPSSTITSDFELVASGLYMKE